jgi:creatinine amidohydrolase
MKKGVRKYFLSNMTWKDAEAILKKTDIALQVVGACEQHGPHLPMGTDTIEALELCHRAAELLQKEGIEVLVSEPIPFGLSQHQSTSIRTYTFRSFPTSHAFYWYDSN